MTEAITDSAGLNGPVVEVPTPRKRSVAPKTPRATKKAAEEAPAEVLSVNIEEAAPTEEKVITGPKKTRGPRKSNVQANQDNVIGSMAADIALAQIDAVIEEDPMANRVALWSDKNVRWAEVGTLTKGYNIVTREAAVKWRNMRGIREATPEEVATYYGK